MSTRPASTASTGQPARLGRLAVLRPGLPAKPIGGFLKNTPQAVGDRRGRLRTRRVARSRSGATTCSRWSPAGTQDPGPDLVRRHGPATPTGHWRVRRPAKDFANGVTPRRSGPTTSATTCARHPAPAADLIDTQQVLTFRWLTGGRASASRAGGIVEDRADRGLDPPAPLGA